MAVWLNSQKKKYKNGQMSDKHIEMLEALKVDLDPEKICR
ncbi:helicase associated domain-containing protein [Ruminococcus sp.]